MHDVVGAHEMPSVQGLDEPCYAQASDQCHGGHLGGSTVTHSKTAWPIVQRFQKPRPLWVKNAVRSASIPQKSVTTLCIKFPNLGVRYPIA